MRDRAARARDDAEDGVPFVRAAAALWYARDVTVTRAELEAYLAEITQASRPEEGVFGPRSIMWRVSRESIGFLAGGCATLMQLAHPFVAQGIADHSRTRDDLAGRFQRTFDNVFAMVFGDLDAALTSARRVHNIHQRVRGHLEEAAGSFAADTRYEANDEHALLWVHATLFDAGLRVHELVLGPLAPADKAAFYAETRTFARLFGIPDRVLPPDWPAFERYMRDTLASGVISPSREAVAMGRFLEQPPRPAVAPLWRVYAIVTAGLLPPSLRDAYEIPWGRADRAIFWSTIQTLRRTYPRLPRRLRYLPTYIDARRRLRGARGGDWFGDLASRIVRGALTTKRAPA